MGYIKKARKDRLKTGPKGPHKNPALVKVPCNTKIPRYVMEALQREPNQAACIERALIFALDIEPPEE